MSNNDYILTSDGELYHYGVVGMKWGVRRYQNKDGSLTEAGKKRLAKDLKKDYKRNYEYGRPYKTSDSYKKKLGDTVARTITPDDRRRIINAKEQWLKSSEKLSKADDAFNKIAEKYGNKFYDEEIRKNPDLYSNPRDKAKLREYSIYERGSDSAAKARPDLYKAMMSALERDIADYDVYQEECRKVCDKMLGKYGSTKLYNDKYNTLTIRDTVGDMVSSMVNDKSDR